MAECVLSTLWGKCLPVTPSRVSFAPLFATRRAAGGSLDASEAPLAAVCWWHQGLRFRRPGGARIRSRASLVVSLAGVESCTPPWPMAWHLQKCGSARSFWILRGCGLIGDSGRGNQLIRNKSNPASGDFVERNRRGNGQGVDDGFDRPSCLWPLLRTNACHFRPNRPRDLFCLLFAEWCNLKGLPSRIGVFSSSFLRRSV